MRPTLCESDLRAYAAEVNVDPLSLLGTTPTRSLIGHSATANPNTRRAGILPAQVTAGAPAYLTRMPNWSVRL